MPEQRERAGPIIGQTKSDAGPAHVATALLVGRVMDFLDLEAMVAAKAFYLLKRNRVHPRSAGAGRPNRKLMARSPPDFMSATILRNARSRSAGATCCQTAVSITRSKLIPKRPSVPN